MLMPQEPERASDPSAAITGGCEAPLMGELNSSPQEEQQVLFTTEWSLQHHNEGRFFPKCQMLLTCSLPRWNTVLQILFLALFLVFWVFFCPVCAQHGCLITAMGQVSLLWGLFLGCPVPSLPGNSCHCSLMPLPKEYAFLFCCSKRC